MATIYKFLIEEQIRSGGSAPGGRKSTTPSAKSVAKTKSVKTPKGTGVEHNRKMRAINPLINKATGGLWEKGLRGGRALYGFITPTGISMVSVAILTQLTIENVLKILKFQQERADRRNNSNYRKMLVGEGSVISSNFDTTVNIINGSHTFNENK